MDYSPSKAVQVEELVMGKYVDRGDPAAPDWTEATLTADGSWHTLDLAGIVGEAVGSNLVHLRLGTRMEIDPHGELIMSLRTKGNVNVHNAVMRFEGTVGITVDEDCWVFMNADAQIEYSIISTIEEVDIVVRGWMED